MVDEIRDYYFKSFEKLSLNRRFHFASRLAAWEVSTEAIEKLKNLKSYMLPTEPRGTLLSLLNSKLGPLYADKLRRPYFDKYNNLHGINSCLFRIRHLNEIYGIDLRNDFLELTNYAELKTLADQLTNDPQALKWLSSFAVNFIYLSEKLYGSSFKIEPAAYLNQFKNFDITDQAQLNLLVYLFTHCVIADSNYYVQTLPESRLSTYRQMMDIIDSLVNKYDVKLDAKLEYLVASRICRQISPHQTRIHHELSKNRSEDCRYIIDPSASRQDWINSFNVSEHRNVLFIMSSSEFKPHKANLD